YRVGVGDVPFDDVIDRQTEPLELRAAAHEHADVLAAVEQLADERLADEARRAGDQRRHRATLARSGSVATAAGSVAVVGGAAAGASAGGALPSRIFKTRAGTPAATDHGGVPRTQTLPAPMMLPSPMTTPSRNIAPMPTSVLSPITTGPAVTRTCSRASKLTPSSAAAAPLRSIRNLPPPIFVLPASVTSRPIRTPPCEWISDRMPMSV